MPRALRKHPDTSCGSTWPEREALYIVFGPKEHKYIDILRILHDSMDLKNICQDLVNFLINDSKYQLYPRVSTLHKARHYWASRLGDGG